MTRNSLERVLDFAHRLPQHSTTQFDDRLGWQPLAIASKESLEATAIAMMDQGFEEGEAFLAPKHDKIHFYVRMQRLPRLAEGDYKVFVPALSNQHNGGHLLAEQKIINVRHVRTYHPCARFDEAQYNNSRSPTRIEFDGKRLKQAINLEVTGKYYSTVFSTFLITIPTPKQWHEAHEEFAQFYKKNMLPYLERRAAKTKDLQSSNNWQQTTATLKEMDSKFFADNEEGYHKLAQCNFEVRHQMETALSRIIHEHSHEVQGMPFVFEYLRVSIFGIDSSGRILHDALFEDLPISKEDLSLALIHRYERLPFNDTFHSGIRRKLNGAPVKYQEYVMKAQSIMYEAQRLLSNFEPMAAIRSAATAFEVALDGFLMEQNVLREPELSEQKYGIDYKLGALFDKAVRSVDPQMEGSYFFNERLRSKITGYDPQSRDVPSITGLRNRVTHHGLFEQGEKSSVAALSAVQTYAEGISYIMQQGWRSNTKVMLDSDMIAWMFPVAKDLIPTPRGREVISDLREVYKKAAQYLHPSEKSILEVGANNRSWIR